MDAHDWLLLAMNAGLLGLTCTGILLFALLIGWLQRIFRPCKHNRVRCIHGDEIWSTMRLNGKIARVRCIDCGKSLVDRDLPEFCTNTGTRHGP